MELILHIGTGKTGSTSIQATLKNNVCYLETHGIFYVGYMFDLLSDKSYSWQRRSGTETFNRLPEAQRHHELSETLKQAKIEAHSKGCTKLLWSNEALCNMPHVASIIKAVWADQVEIIAYVRRHDDYAVSAYKQWALKHKIHEGELLSFEEFTHRFPLTYYDRLAVWNNEAWQFNIFNYHLNKNIVECFFEYLQVCVPEKSGSERKNANDSLTNLLAKTLINTSDKTPNLNNQFSIGDDYHARDEDWFFDKLPKKEEVESVFEFTMSDRKKVNKLLGESNEFSNEPLDFQPYSREDVADAYKNIYTLVIDKVINNDVKWEKQNKIVSRVTESEKINQILLKKVEYLETLLNKAHHEMNVADSRLEELMKENANVKILVEDLHSEVVSHNKILTRLTKKERFGRLIRRIGSVLKGSR